MKQIARATTRFFVTTFAVFACCFPSSPKQEEEGEELTNCFPSSPKQLEEELTIPNLERFTSSTTLASECHSVAISDDSFVMELQSRIKTMDDSRKRLQEALEYHTPQLSIRSVSSESLQITEEMDISHLSLSVDEITMMRRVREAEQLAERLRKERRTRNIFKKMSACFRRS